MALSEELRGPETVEALDKSQPKDPEERSILASRIILFVVLFLLWMVFSGKFDPFHLSLGVISSTIVSVFAGPLIPELRGKGLMRSWGRFLSYLPWLLWQIWLANLHMLRLSFSPRVLDLIDPEIITFNPGLKKDLSKLTLANSITLTPGTITISISTYGTFRVHRIDKVSAEGITSGTMIEKVKKAFGES